MARAPVVTSPLYPNYVFPSVPFEFSRSPATAPHQEAWSYLQTGDLQGAEGRYSAALDAAPGFYPATTGLGWVSLARNDLDGAARYFARAMTEAEGYVPALIGHADAMTALGRPADALASYEAALRVDPSLTQIGQRVEELRFTVATGQLAAAREAAAAERYAEATAAYERVIATSPESAFLRIELGRVEFRQGNVMEALRHARIATELDSDDPDAFLLQGELYEAARDFGPALQAYEHADTLDPTDETARRIERVRRFVNATDLPPELQRIPSQTQVTRGELAAVLGARLSELLEASAGSAVIVTDTRGHWAADWVQVVADAQIMDVDAAYRFAPAETVRRSDLADVVSETLDRIERETGSGPLDLRRGEGFSDMRPTHLSYEAAMRAVASGVLDRLPSNSFRPGQVVTGAEAIEAIERLSALFLEFR